VTGGVFWSPVEPLEPASGAFFRGSARDEFLTGGEFPEPDEDPLPCFSVETVDPLVDPLARSASFFLFMASRTFFLFCSRVTGAVVVVDTGAGGGATSLAGAVLARLDWSPELPLAVVEAWDDEAELVREDENTFPPFSPAWETGEGRREKSVPSIHYRNLLYIPNLHMNTVLHAWL
jgi:hypothetical protein